MFNLALLAKQASTRPGHHFETTRRSPPKCAPPCVRPRHARSPVALVALSHRAQARCCKRPDGPALSNGAHARCCKRASALGRSLAGPARLVRCWSRCWRTSFFCKFFVVCPPFPSSCFPPHHPPPSPCPWSRRPNSPCRGRAWAWPVHTWSLRCSKHFSKARMCP